MSQAIGLIETRGLVGPCGSQRRHGESRQRGTGKDRADRRRLCHRASCAATWAVCAPRWMPGATAAKSVGELISSHVIPRPHDALVESMLN